MKVLCRALALLLICTACSAAQARQTRRFTFEERGEVIGRLYRLGLENDRRHIGTFCEALKDRNPEVREAAIAQLVFTHDETALEPVIEAMKDDSRQVRRCAIAVLERVGSPQAIPVLTEALTYRPSDYREDEPLRFEEYFNRLAAALALHRLGSDAGRATVLECLETQDNKMVQTMALKAVLYMDLKEAIPGGVWERDFGNSLERWLRAVAADLREWGFNTIGWTQEVVIITDGYHRHSRPFAYEEYQWAGMPYCHLLPFTEAHEWQVEVRMPDPTRPESEGSVR